MLSKVKSASLLGIKAYEVSVEVDYSKGIPKEIIVGLPDAVIKESKSRVKYAIKNSGYKFPSMSYTINLGPAELPKEGPFFDLPIALGILISTQQIFIDKQEKSLYIGELALNGDVKPVKGIVSICHMASSKGYKKIFLPYDNYQEATLISGIQIIPIKTLYQAINYLETNELPKIPSKSTTKLINHYQEDFKDVKGQLLPKRALEIVAAGNHNILFIGSPGAGKTMLLKRLPSILPPMDINEAIETYKIYSLLRLSENQVSLNRPFRNPHHTISYAGMVGGGQNPQPGEISLAHNGILFLDELPEFPRNVLEVLRQPMEEKRVTISRSNMSIDYPADFLLVAAMNPCPCGYHKDPLVSCSCQTAQIKKYYKKISGPILDRIDLIVEVPRLKKEDIFNKKELKENPYTSKKLRERINKARKIQYRRISSNLPNAKLAPAQIEKYCQIDLTSEKFLGKAIESGFLTGRSYHKVLKIARTIADLANSDKILQSHISEAMQYRKLDKFFS